MSPPVSDALTAKQIETIRRTWAVVAKEITKHGVSVFIELFKVNTQYQKMFSNKSFVDVPLEEMRENEDLAKHATTVMIALGDIVDKIDDPAFMKQAANRVCRVHGKYGLKMKDYEITADVIMKVLQDALGDAFTPDAKSAWQTALNELNGLIEQGLAKK